MPQVVIDGVEYTAGATARYGVAITTHNRPTELAKAIEQHQQHSKGAVLVVVDDGSTPPAKVPDGVTLIRHEQSRGIVAAKNASLVALIDAGCEYLSLWDDDAYPITDDWAERYMASPEGHLAYQFKDLSGPRKLNDIAVLHEDTQHVAYTGQRGVMLWYHRSVIEQVGGFDPIYGRGFYEHSDLALRIWHAGLTTWAYADITGSDKLIYSMDEHEAVQRSVSSADRQALVKVNAAIHNERRDTGTYPAFVPYRDTVDVVITTLLTSQPDPQRGKKWPAESKTLQAWASSIKGGKAVVLADELTTPPKGAELVPVPTVDMNVYYRRWLHIYQHLRDHPEYGNVWCTDGSDVEMLQQPWADMEPGKVYVGSEPKTYDDEWAIKNHPARVFQEFLTEHRHDTMLNAGILGGTREDVMGFAHRILRVYYLKQSRRFWKQETSPVGVGDMIAFGIAAHAIPDRIVTGPRVNTTFRAEERTPWAWWKHR